MTTIKEFYNSKNFGQDTIARVVRKYINEFNLDYSPKLFKELHYEIKPLFKRIVPIYTPKVDSGKMGFLNDNYYKVNRNY